MNPKNRNKGKYYYLLNLSYRRLFTLWVGVVFAFALGYYLLSYTSGHAPSNFEDMGIVSRFLQALYFSIVTATSTGYGDIVPMGLSRLLASVEAVLGLGIFAMFTARIMTVRQQEIDDIIYKDIRQTTIRNMREDFHIVRKDFKKLIGYVKSGEGVNERGWERLTVTYRQMSRLVRKLTLIYNEDGELDSLDESVVLQGLYRTLGRMVKFNDLLEKTKIEKDADIESNKHLIVLVELIEELITEHTDDMHPYNLQTTRGITALLEQLDNYCVDYLKG